MKILNQKTIEYTNWTINKLRIEPPFELDLSQMYIGIDPGTVNLGVAVSYPFSNPTLEIFEVTIKRSKDPVERIISAQFILSDCINTYIDKAIAVIESSAFSQRYRQVELAEVRASYVLWCKSKFIEPILVSPQEIRKKVFGSAKKRAEEEWKELPPNAASALACMYYTIL